MLKVLRDSMKYLAWILWAVIAVFILFVFVDFGGSMPGAQPNRAAATVGDQSVTYRELEREHRNLEADMRNRLGEQFTPELAEQMRLPMQALNQVIDRKVLLAEAARMDLRVSDEELRRYILDLPAFNDGGRFVGQEAYDRFLRRNNYTPDSFEAEIREQLLMQRFVTTVESSLAVSEREIEQRYRDQVERASIRYVTLPATQLRSEVKPTPQEVEEFFASRREEYTVPEERTARFLLVNSRTVRESLEIPADEIAAFYAENEADYFEQEQVKARHILIANAERGPEAARALAQTTRERIEAGEDFAAVARELSDDPGSKTRGGDLGYFGRGRMVAPFETAVFGAEAGSLIGPTETQFGFHIIEVQDHKPERQRPLEEVTELIQNRLAAERAATRTEELIRELHAELTGEAPRSFDEIAASDDAYEIGETRPFRQEGAILPLGNAPALNPQVFALDIDGLTEPAQVGRGWVVLQLSEIIAEHLPELDEVRGQVRRDLVEQRAADLALARVVAAYEAAAEAEDPVAAVAEALGQEIVDSPSFAPAPNIPQLGAAPELSEAIFASEEGSLGEPTLVGDKAILYQVTQRRRFSSDEFETQRPQIRRQMVREQLQATLTSLINQRKDQLGVEYDRGLLESWDLLDSDQQG